MSSLSRLFRPISIGTMEVKNRIAMAPMATDYADSDGTDLAATDRLSRGASRGRCRTHYIRDDDD